MLLVQSFDSVKDLHWVGITECYELVSSVDGWHRIGQEWSGMKWLDYTGGELWWILDMLNRSLASSCVISSWIIHFSGV